MMVGSAAFGALIAQIVFAILMVHGGLSGGLRRRGLVVFGSLWLLGYFGLPHVPYGAALTPTFVAVLDIALVFVIFKGDVRLT